MLFSWWKNRRRRKILEHPFPEDWLSILADNMAHYQFLNPTEQARLGNIIQIIIAEKSWEGCGGLAMTEEVQVTVAGHAGLLVLGLKDNYFDNVDTILVYPSGYVAPRQQLIGESTILEGEVEHLGEAHYRGPVVLSWQELLADGREPGHGRNLAFHEFAHQLDMQDGILNGTPLLESKKQARRWHRVMTAEFRRLRHDAQRGRATVLDDYGATDEAEFFAVATEAFFDQPNELRQRHPQLYDLLQGFYGQDPAQRLPY